MADTLQRHNRSLLLMVLLLLLLVAVLVIGECGDGCCWHCWLCCWCNNCFFRWIATVKSIWIRSDRRWVSWVGTMIHLVCRWVCFDFYLGVVCDRSFFVSIVVSASPRCIYNYINCFREFFVAACDCFVSLLFVAFVKFIDTFMTCLKLVTLKLRYAVDVYAYRRKVDSNVCFVLSYERRKLRHLISFH